MPLFHLGALVISTDAAVALKANATNAISFLVRHQRGDWGEEDEYVRRENAAALKRLGPLFSTYTLSDGTKILVMTTADRSETRLLLAAEYCVREVSVQSGYAIWASFYDSQKNPLVAVEEPYVAELIATLPMTNALDVGTGTGRHALKLARRGVRVTALDSSPEMLAIARRSAENEHLSIDFRLASLNDGLPFAEGEFDFLINALMLCHLSDLTAAIQECCRVVKPGGFLLITDFHPETLTYGWRTALTRGDIKYWLPNPQHTRDEYLDALESAGFGILKAIDVPVREAPEGYLPEEIRQNHPDWLLGLIILAQKPV